MPKFFIVDDNYHNTRLDKWFVQKIITLPHSLVEKIIRQNKIKVNKKKTKSSYRLQNGDLIEIYDISKFKPISKEIKVKYKPKKNEISKYDDYVIEDNENFIVVNKPTGLPVQSGTKSFKNLIDVDISLILFGFTKMELTLFKISLLNGKFEDIIGNPQAIASIIAFEQPSFNVGKTNTSAQFKKSGRIS